MSEGGVSPEEAGIAVQERPEGQDPKILIDSLRQQYVSAMKKREVTTEDFYPRARTADERAQATGKMSQENERIRALKETTRDQISSQLATAILGATSENRSLVINGVRDITGESLLPKGVFSRQHEQTLDETVDLMSRTMVKMAELTGPQPPQK